MSFVMNELISDDDVVSLQQLFDVPQEDWRRFLLFDVITLCVSKSEEMLERNSNAGFTCRIGSEHDRVSMTLIGTYRLQELQWVQ